MLIGKLAADREAASDVGCVAAILRAHVEQAHVTILQRAVVGGTGVAVVQCGTMVPGRANLHGGQPTAQWVSMVGESGE